MSKGFDCYVASGFKMEGSFCGYRACSAFNGQSRAERSKERDTNRKGEASGGTT